MRFFNRTTLQTPESVDLEFTLAGIGNRAWALLIDYTILLIGVLALVLVFQVIASQLPEVAPALRGSSQDPRLWLLVGFGLALFFMVIGYFVGFETLWQGQTPGKRFAKIRVIRDDGRPVGILQATLRALLRSIDDVSSLGFFLIVWGKREKRLGDWVAGTLVIQEEQPVAAAMFSVSPSAQSLADELLQSAQLSLLLPDDFAVIREYLQRRRGLTAEAKTRLAQQLAQQVLGVIHLEKVPAQASSELFLEAIYLAYQQQARA